MSSLRFHSARKRKSVTPFSSYKIYHTASTLRYGSILSAPLSTSLLYREKYQVPQHLVQTRETLAPRYKRRHLLLFHVPLTLVPWNFLLPSRARRAVYGAVASSGLREIINIGSYERARSCGENSADTTSRCVQPVAKLETAIFSSNIKENDLCIRSRERRVTMTYFWNSLIYQSVLFNLRVSRKNTETCPYMYSPSLLCNSLFIQVIGSKNENFLRNFLLYVCKRLFRWYFRTFCSLLSVENIIFSVFEMNTQV